MATITRSDADNLLNSDSVKAAWATSLSGAWDRSDSSGTKIVHAGRVTFWQCSGSGNATVTVPASPYQYMATFLYGAVVNSRQPAADSGAKAVAIAAGVSNMSIVQTGAWQVSGWFFSKEN